jgi:hypothetical protein
MAKTCFQWKPFNATAMAIIADAEILLDSYSRQGYRITLRTLYYQFIARDLFPESRRDKVSGTKNTEKNYKWLGGIVSDARLAGLLDWRHLQDSGRESHGGDGGWGEPRNIIDYGATNYNITHWDDQPQYVEIWVEKQALEDIVARPCLEWNVKYFACKGYVSQSSMYEAAMRLRRIDGDREKTIIHLGDHDPSGIDMSRDIQDRLNMFGAGVEVKRIALNMHQVEAYDPPPSPAKITDSRAADYIDNYGEDSWELDALEPSVLNELITGEITSRLDMDLYEARIAREERERSVLVAMRDNYDDLHEYMTSQGMISGEESD